MQTGQVRVRSRATAPVRYSLPADTAVFTGRDKEVEFITGAVAAASRGTVMSCGIDGMPGLGKTALAIHVAHLLRPQFADRQMFIDLHGHTPGQLPMTPEAALASLLGIGYRGSEVEVLNELGTLHRVRSDMAEAVRWHRSALRVAQEIDSAWDEAHAVAGLARCDLAAGLSTDGESRLRQAHKMFQRMGAAETRGVAAELAAVAGEGTV